MNESQTGVRRWSLHITRHRFDAVLVLAPEGRVGALSTPILGAELRAAIDQGSRGLVVDFERVDYLSSPGLQVLEEARTRLDALGGRLVLCALSEPVRLAIDLAGLTPRFTIETTRAGAVACCREALLGQR